MQKHIDESQDMDTFASVWEKISSKTSVMVVRGEDSDILVKETVDRMRSSGPGVDVYFEVPRVGHAPMLLEEEQTTPIREFLCAARS